MGGGGGGGPLDFSVTQVQVFRLYFEFKLDLTWTRLELDLDWTWTGLDLDWTWTFA